MLAELTAELASEGSKELLQAVGVAVVIAVSALGRVRGVARLLGSDGYVNNGGGNARGQRFHCTIERKQRADAVVIESCCGCRGLCRSHGVIELIGCKRKNHRDCTQTDEEAPIERCLAILHPAFHGTSSP